jgi:hypothetical protein
MCADFKPAKKRQSRKVDNGSDRKDDDNGWVHEGVTNALQK